MLKAYPDKADISKDKDISDYELKRGMAVQKAIDDQEKNEALNDCKTFLNLSLIEGGPVTLLEAVASGCNTISKDNGIANDINLDFPERCFNIKNILSSENLSKAIIKIYKIHLKNKNNNHSYSETINSYSFGHLGKKIIEVLEI